MSEKNVKHLLSVVIAVLVFCTTSSVCFADDSAASEAVGYGKSLMLFHMVRRAIGDEAFTAGLKRLWQRHAFTRIGFADTVRTLAGDDDALNVEFQAWLGRSGAPHLSLVDSRAVPAGDGWELTMDLAQRQPEPFTFDLPIAVTLAGQPVAQIHTVRLSERKQQVRLHLASRPLRVDVDPYYDVLRYLDATEQPPALNRLFGSRRTWLVMPTAAPPEMRAAWESLADAWSQRYSGLSRIDDTDAADLDPVPQYKRPDPSRPVKLVRRHGHGIHSQLAEADR